MSPMPPGLPRFAVVEIEWDDDGEPRKRKFGPWLISADDSHLAVISGFICGWSIGSGIDPATATLTVGDESVAEGAVSPYREQPTTASATTSARPGATSPPDEAQART
jgi:hypothetical protein